MIQLRKPFAARFALLLLAPAALVSSVAAPQAQAKTKPAGIVWRTSLSGALKEAKRLRKPLIVNFSASWCLPCKEMKQKTYVNRAVVRESKRFVMVHVDLDKNEALAKKYKISIIPTRLFMRPNGSVVQSDNNFVAPAAFVKKMRAARVKATKRQSVRA